MKDKKTALWIAWSFAWILVSVRRWRGSFLAYARRVAPSLHKTDIRSPALFFKTAFKRNEKFDRVSRNVQPLWRMAQDEMTQKKSLEELALDTLRAVCEDEEAAPAARAGAARSLLEAAGVLKGGAAASAQKRDLTSMTAAEIEAEINRLSGR